jgi:hypothetical protein
MQPVKSIQSLEDMCLKVIVDHYNQNNLRIDQDNTIQNKIAPSLFLKLKNIQDHCVNLQIFNCRNHNFCLHEQLSFSLNTPFKDIRYKLTARIGCSVKSIWVAKYSNTMWIKVHEDKCLNTYGFKPGEELKILFE